MSSDNGPDEPFYFDEVIGSLYGYHRPECHIVERIWHRNRKRLRNWEEAARLGLKPCPHCRPPSLPTAEPSPDRISSGPTTTATLSANDLADYRRALLRLLESVDVSGARPVDETVAGRIARLSRAEVIPREVAAFMRTVTEARNAVEYQAKTLSPAETLAVRAAWLAIADWAQARGLSLPPDLAR